MKCSNLQNISSHRPITFPHCEYLLNKCRKGSSCAKWGKTRPHREPLCLCKLTSVLDSYFPFDSMQTLNYLVRCSFKYGLKTIYFCLMSSELFRASEARGGLYFLFMTLESYHRHPRSWMWSTRWQSTCDPGILTASPACQSHANEVHFDLPFPFRKATGPQMPLRLAAQPTYRSLS